MRKRHVVFYVSSHGLGHLTRCVEVAHALRLLASSHSPVSDTHITITFVTRGSNCEILGARPLRADDDFEDGNTHGDGDGDGDGDGGRSSCITHVLEETFPVRDRDLDAGAVQLDAFTIDVDATRNAATAFHALLDGLVAEEAAWLAEAGADLVVSDVVGLALSAARRAGVKSVLMTNFSWGFIYGAFVTRDVVTRTGCAFGDVVAREDAMLEEADVFLRLPGHSSFSQTLERRAKDVPMIVRTQREGREAMRARFGISSATRVCLVMVGGHALGMALDWRDVERDSWVYFVTASVLGGEVSIPPHVRVVPPDAFIPDMVAMADVVLGKVGYGTVSECLAARTPLVYVPRLNFAEERDIVSLLTANGAGVEMSRETFVRGRWADALEAAVALRPHVVRVDASGAQTVGAMLLSML